MEEFSRTAFLIDPGNRAILGGSKRLLFKNASLFKAFRLVRHGKALPGEVVFCSRLRNEDGNLIVHMKFRFQTPDGRTIESVERFSGASLPGETLPAPRTPVVVYYAGDDCFTVL